MSLFNYELFDNHESINYAFGFLMKKNQTHDLFSIPKHIAYYFSALGPYVYFFTNKQFGL